VKRLRLDRLLANLGYGTRRSVQNLFNSGFVTLDGVEVEDSSDHVVLSPDLPSRLLVEGEPLDPLPGLTILLHKPTGYTCSHKEEEGDLVYDLLPERWSLRDPPLSTIGRLDKETSGLLLITDDGDLLHKIISPKQRINKYYLAKLARPLAGNEAKIFSAGTLMLENEKKPLLPASLEVIDATTARICLQEGRYHQVRRMFAAVGNHVLTLHRERIGALSLPKELAPGEYRALTEAELALVFSER
jgi:16S rRNA pseudouridine516 synthase